VDIMNEEGWVHPVCSTARSPASTVHCVHCVHSVSTLCARLCGVGVGVGVRAGCTLVRRCCKHTPALRNEECATPPPPNLKKRVVSALLPSLLPSPFASPFLPTRWLAFFTNMFYFKGTVFPAILPQIVLAAFIATGTYWLWREKIFKGMSVSGHTALAGLVSTLLVFRNNLSHARWGSAGKCSRSVGCMSLSPRVVVLHGAASLGYLMGVHVPPPTAVSPKQLPCWCLCHTLGACVSIGGGGSGTTTPETLLACSRTTSARCTT
jgi:hypothetical protein